MTVEVTPEELRYEVGKEAFCTFSDGTKFRMSELEIYMPNASQCWRTVEIMKEIAKGIGIKTDGVFIKKPVLANEGWYFITVKFQSCKNADMKKLLCAALYVRREYAKSTYKKDNGDNNVRGDSN